MALRFNMGCGRDKRPGYINVDSTPACGPDEVWDLEQTPWPWPDSCAEQVLFIHSLEHMGADPKVFLAIMQELYRIAAPGCQVEIHVPHPRHDHFLNDPTHVRAITPDMMIMFDRAENDRWAERGAANTPLAHYTGVDFVLERSLTVPDEPYATQLRAGTLSGAELSELVRHQYNVAREHRIYLRARKPAP